MKEKLEVITNITLIGLACVIGYNFWQTQRIRDQAPPASIKAGDLLPSLPGFEWNAHDRTLVLVLETGCRYCEESIPFYRRLVELQESNQTDAHLVAIFPDDQSTVRQFVETQRLTIEALPGI